jgi:hypothetical protein
MKTTRSGRGSGFGLILCPSCPLFLTFLTIIPRSERDSQINPPLEPELRWVEPDGD